MPPRHGSAVSAVALALNVLNAAPLTAQERAPKIDYPALLERYASGDEISVSTALALSDSEMMNALQEHLESLRARYASERRAQGTSAIPLSREPLGRMRCARLRALKLHLLLQTEAVLSSTSTRQLERHDALARQAASQLLRLKGDFEDNGPLECARDEPGEAARSGATSTPEGRARLGRAEWEELRLGVRDWYLLIVSYLQSAGSPPMLAEHVKEGLERFVDDPELLLARGTLSEGAATAMVVDRSIGDEIYTGEFLSNRRSMLDRAASDYERALDRQPTLYEAALRRGRARFLQGNLKAARSYIEPLRQGSPPAFVRYLAWLFLGDVEERESKWEAARHAYEQARRIAPQAQAPLLAMSRLCDAAADARCAREFLERSLSAVSAKRLDPWWDYHRGQAWLGEIRLSALRARVMPR
jgi:tetratricopeptide (TPR) repeat protein